jgi:hypothetical protein
MGNVEKAQYERLQANIDACKHFLELAYQLRGTDPAQCSISQADWQRALYQVLNAPEGQPSDALAVSEAIRLAHKIARRLADSGIDRLYAFKHKMNPDGSIAGQRFYKDLETAEKRLAVLQTFLNADA